MEQIVVEQAVSVEEMEDPRIVQERLLEAAGGIVQRLTSLAADAVQKRKEIESRWLEDMCQFAGVRNISDAVDKDKPLGRGNSRQVGSSVFVNITRPKTNRTEGRLCDILFPADDRNWGIQPTPSPELSMVARKAMQEAERAAAEANRLSEAPPGATSPEGMTADELLQMAGDLGPQGAEAAKSLTEAKERAARMATEIDDQLVEARFAQKSRDAIGWACKLGVGVLKGPVVMEGGKRRWKAAEQAQGQTAGSPQYTLEHETEANRPTVECISPWSFFPDPSASSMDDAEYVFERHLVSKRDLHRLGKSLGFYAKPLRELLKAGPGEGATDDLQYLRDIRSLTGENTSVTGRYIVWEYHGQLKVEEVANLIRAIGTPEAIDRAAALEEGADPTDERMVIAFFCDNRILKISEYYPMDSGELIYSVFSLEKGSASILGAIGVPRMMRDSQEVLNAAWRMMMDNAGLSVSPQVLIDKKAVQPEDGDWALRPRKGWLWDSSNGGGEPFKVFNIPMNQEQIAGIIGLAKSFIDDETAMPSFIEGGVSDERAPGAASTVGGFAMLLNSAGVNIRRMVKNWDDDVTTPIVRRVYDWNMQYSTKDEIKGDMCVEARGTSVLLAREMQAGNLAAMAATWTVHPVLGPAHKPYDMARLTYQSLSINPSDVLIDEDEYKKKIEAMSGQQEPEDPQWAVRERIAQMDRDARLQEAMMQRDIAMLRLSETSQLSIEQIAADLEKTRIKEASSERKLAAEIAVETRAAREAESMGRIPTGSGGAFSMGSRPA